MNILAQINHVTDLAVITRLPDGQASVSLPAGVLLAALEAAWSETLSLLGEALESVEADEQAKRESWPAEIASGEMKLDLTERIRALLAREQRA